MTNTSMRNNKGFTLLEVMLSLSIISISLMVIIHSFSLAISVKNSVNNYSKAIFLSEKKLSEIKLSGSDKMENNGKFLEPFERFNWQIKADRTNFSDLAKIDLIIEWTQQGKLKNFQVSTIMEK